MSSAIKSKKRSRPSEGPSIAAEIELALGRKKALDTELLNLERQIYALETSYLENTAQLGDLIRGWGDFTTPSSPGGPGGSTALKKKKRIHDHERIFSSSSVSALKNPEFHGLNNGLHSTTNPTGGAPRSHHGATHLNSMDEDDHISPALSLDMDADAASRHKNIKRAPDNGSAKKARATAPKTASKIPKPSMPHASSSLLGDSDTLGSFHPADDPFGQ